KYTDYRALAETMHQFFLQQYESDCYFAVSGELESWKDMPGQFRALEKLLEEQFYQPGQHVFISGAVREAGQDSAAEDSEIMEQISKDIKYKDIVHLKQNFERLELKYRVDKQFSEMYVKFVFSSILKEIYEQLSTLDEKTLSKKVDRLYRCRKIQDVLDIVSESVEEFEKCMMEQED